MSKKPIQIHLDPYEGKVVLAKRGLIGAGWCCALKSLSLEEVQRLVHQQIEPYLPAMHGEDVTPWTVVRREHPDEEWVSPGRCNDSEDRQHWFMIGGMSGVFLLAMGDHEGIEENTRIQTADDYHAARNILQ